MKIIRDRSDNRVIYAGNVSLSENGVRGEGFIDTRATPDVVELIEVAQLPEYYEGGKFSYRNSTWTCIDKEYYNERKRADLAAQRFEMETSGVAYGDHIILTDRESCQILDSTAEKIRRGLIPAVNWKCKTGWITLTPANIDEIEILVLTHVQTAFAWEKMQSDALDETPE